MSRCGSESWGRPALFGSNYCSRKSRVSLPRAIALCYSGRHKEETNGLQDAQEGSEACAEKEEVARGIRCSAQPEPRSLSLTTTAISDTKVKSRRL
jgi:hypothetical protein